MRLTEESLGDHLTYKITELYREITSGAYGAVECRDPLEVLSGVLVHVARVQRVAKGGLSGLVGFPRLQQVHSDAHVHGDYLRRCKEKQELYHGPLGVLINSPFSRPPLTQLSGKCLSTISLIWACCVSRMCGAK